MFTGANLLVSWASLLADKERELKLLQEKLCDDNRSWSREEIPAITTKKTTVTSRCLYFHGDCLDTNSQRC